MSARMFVIVVSGGMVRSVYSPDASDRVIVLDCDDLECDPEAFADDADRSHLIAALEDDSATDTPTLRDGTTLHAIY